MLSLPHLQNHEAEAFLPERLSLRLSLQLWAAEWHLALLRAVRRQSSRTLSRRVSLIALHFQCPRENEEVWWMVSQQQRCLEEFTFKVSLEKERLTRSLRANCNPITDTAEQRHSVPFTTGISTGLRPFLKLHVLQREDQGVSVPIPVQIFYQFSRLFLFA